MAKGLRIKIDERAIDGMVRAGIIGDSAKKASEKFIREAQNILIANNAIDTRRLFNSFEVEDLTSGQTANFQVTANTDYAKYVEEGRGPVRPNKAKVLRFKPKGSSTYIFRPYAGPAKGIHFMRGASQRLRSSDYN